MKSFYNGYIGQVMFIGEAGSDTGGLKQEFWRIFAYSAAEKYFIGDKFKTLQQNVLDLQVSFFVVDLCKLFFFVKSSF